MNLGRHEMRPGGKTKWAYWSYVEDGFYIWLIILAECYKLAFPGGKNTTGKEIRIMVVIME